MATLVIEEKTTQTVDVETVCDHIEIVPNTDYHEVMREYGLTTNTDMVARRYQNKILYQLIAPELPGEAHYSGMYRVGDNQLLTIRDINNEKRAVIAHVQLDLYGSVTDLVDEDV